MMMMINQELRCEYCDEKVTYGDNYENHLIIIHGLKKGITEIMARALEGLKKNANRNIQPKVIEEITLDDSDDDEDEAPIQAKAVPPIKLEKLETTIEQTLDESIKKMFSNLNLIIEGMLPEARDDSNNQTQTTTVEESEDMEELPEEIAVCFDELRSIVDEIDFSNIFIRQKEESNDNIVDKNQLTNQNNLRNQNVAIATVKDIVSEKQKKKIVSPTKPTRPVPKPGQTLFLCPVAGCSFYTTKEGFKNKQAAFHLSNDHKVTLKDMEPGKFKFDKIKGEKIR